MKADREATQQGYRNEVQQPERPMTEAGRGTIWRPEDSLMHNIMRATPRIIEAISSFFHGVGVYLTAPLPPPDPNGGNPCSSGTCTASLIYNVFPAEIMRTETA